MIHHHKEMKMNQMKKMKMRNLKKMMRMDQKSRKDIMRLQQ